MTDKAPQSSNRSLPLGPGSDPPTGPSDPPAFGCVVYVRKDESGRVSARVANLDDLRVESSSERAALSELVPQIKRHLADLHRRGVTPDPTADPPRDGEAKRFLPVHL